MDNNELFNNISSICSTIESTEDENKIEKNLNDSISFLHPLKTENIKSDLLGEDKSSTAFGYINRTGEVTTLKFIEKFRNLLPNQNFNPHKEYKPLDYWVEPTEIIKKFDDYIIERKKNNLQANIIHLGNKGSGKTLTQNCWLKKRNTILENEKIFWVRFDGHKLYDLWSDYDIKDIKVDAKLITVEDYFNIQLIYVFAKYCYMSNRKMFNDIILAISKQMETYDYQIGKQWENTEKRLIISGIEEVHRNIIEKEKLFSDERHYSYAVDEIMKDAQITTNIYQRAKNNWINLSLALQSFLREKGYFILRIFDGLDNIELTNNNSLKYYKKMLNQAYKYIFEKSAKNHINFIALRERTYIDIYKEYWPSRTTDSHHPTHLTINHITPPLSKILNNRLEYINNEYAHNLKNNSYKKLQNEFLRKTITTSNLNVYYHDNVRSFLYNSYTLTLYVYYRWLQLGKKADFDYIYNFNHFRNRNKFLNGRLYMDSLKYPDLSPKSGAFSYNIFFSKPNNRGGNLGKKWQGLCTTRIIQLLSSNEIISEIKAINYIRRQFGYSIDQIKKSIDLSKNFGLIDTKYDNEENNVYIVASTKGKSLLEMLYSDLDSIYLLALDTYLPNFFFSDHLVLAHNNKFNKLDKNFPAITNYGSSCIITSISFITFIMFVHRLEMKNFNKRIRIIPNIKTTLFHPPLSKKRIKAKLLKRVKELLNSISIHERNILDNYLKYFSS